MKRSAELARRQGFAGMLAIHPGQVPIINSVFAPNEIGYARRVLETVLKTEVAEKTGSKSGIV